MSRVIFVSGKEVEKLLPMKEAITVVANAFAGYASGKNKMVEKVYLTLPEFNGDFRAMPACIPQENIAGVKWVNSHPGNAALKKPAVLALMILNQASTGLPLAILDGTHLTAIRTGAAGAVAIKYLARKNSKSAAFVACGTQAYYQFLGLIEVANIEEIYLYDLDRDKLSAFASKIKKKFKKKIHLCNSVKDAVHDADIVIATTPAKSPVILSSYIKKGAHINAMGADAPGKQELDPAILKMSRVFIDDIHQAAHSGEINVPLKNKKFHEKDIEGTLGEVVYTNQFQRKSDDITIFDSTGLAIQDIEAAFYIYKQAKKIKDISSFTF